MACALCEQDTVVEHEGRLEFRGGAARCPVCGWGSALNRMDCWGSAMWDRWHQAKREWRERQGRGEA
jgi:hypothetical protein